MCPHTFNLFSHRILDARKKEKAQKVKQLETELDIIRPPQLPLKLKKQKDKDVVRDVIPLAQISTSATTPNDVDQQMGDA